MKLAFRAPLVFALVPLAVVPGLSACSGGGSGSGAPSGALTQAGWSEETVDFETLTPGMVVSQVFGSLGTGPVGVSGSNPALGPVNAAIVFDSSNRTGGDTDLGTPNQDFGGPGVGTGGAMGSPFMNDRSLGHLLIVAENLNDANGDGIIDDPDDSNDPAATLEFDFSAIGTVTAMRVTVIDIDANPGARVELFDAMNVMLANIPLPNTGDNGVAIVDLGAVQGVARMAVRLDGSGGVDELVFKKECTGRIGDFVWHDLDRDGIQDAGEPGIEGVTLLLEDLTGAQLMTTTTGMGGMYEFSGVCAGDYRVRVDGSTLPPGFEASPCNAGDDDTADNDCSPANVTLAQDDSFDPTIDFGFKTPCTGSIGDFVWHDLDRNGLQDAGEPGIAGVSLVLRDQMGGLVATTTSDRNGFYEFTGLCAGTYVVEVDAETVPMGFFPSDCDVGDDDTLDNDCSGVTVVLVTDDAHDPTVDFGFQSACTGSIGDFVWHDLDRDGIQDEGEPGLEGITLRLKSKTGETLGMTMTGREGGYEFGGLCAGEYVVEVDEETLPPGFEPSPCDAGDDDALDNDCSPVCVVLDADDSTDDTVDFGYSAVCTGEIGDLVWHDMNRDGLQGEDEPGIEGVEVILKDDMGVVLCTRTTDAEGRYLFMGLCAGMYKVEVNARTLPPGFEPAPCNVGDDDAIDNDCSPAMVELATDDSRDKTIDFGYVSVCEGVIGDFVWNDLDADGLQDEGEPGIEGVVLRLKNLMGEVLSMQTTDADGGYEFSGLCAGKYVVVVDPRTLPHGLVPTECNVGEDDSIDNDCSPACVELVTDDEVNDTVDFGYRRPFEGCTPGYWKQPHHFDSWPEGLTPETPFSDVFEDAFPGKTLLDALEEGGGMLDALGRHTVAALLNGASPDVNYPLSGDEVVEMFDDVFPGSDHDYEELKDFFEAYNQLGCPLN